MKNKKMLLAGLGVLIIAAGAGIALLGRAGEEGGGMEAGVQLNPTGLEEGNDAAGSPDPGGIYPDGDAPSQLAQDAEAEPPTPRPGLESTDPSTVDLASGELQLVEFFAFW